MIRIDALWLSAAPLDMRAGMNTLHARWCACCRGDAYARDPEAGSRP